MQIDARHVERNIRCEGAQLREAGRNRVIDFERRAPARIARCLARLIALREALRAK
jgi:hypothetical protein